MYSGAKWFVAAAEAVHGNVEDSAAFLRRAAAASGSSDLPRGPVQLDEYGSPIENIYIRKVERVNGELQNTVIETFPAVSQFWKYNPAEYLKQPLYSREYQVALQALAILDDCRAEPVRPAPAGVCESSAASKAVDGVNLAVHPGERRAVIGPNGAGKTTLFNLISGEIPATEGRISVWRRRHRRWRRISGRRAGSPEHFRSRGFSATSPSSRTCCSRAKRSTGESSRCTGRSSSCTRSVRARRRRCSTNSGCRRSTAGARPQSVLRRSTQARSGVVHGRPAAAAAARRADGRPLRRRTRRDAATSRAAGSAPSPCC